MKTSVILTAVLLLAAIPGIADNLVTNGGFETGDFTGWTVLDNDGYTFVTSPVAYDGAYSAVFGTIGHDTEIEQTITDVAGQHYFFSFFYENPGFTPNDFTAQWNGATLFQSQDSGLQDWTQYSFEVVGTGSDTIAFFGRNDPAYTALDSVSVSLPEPSFAWVGIGLMFALFLKLRRRSGAAVQ